jgi:hypothetical protein
MKRAVDVLRIQQVFTAWRVRDRHHDRTADKFGESREQCIHYGRPPILSE